MSTPEIQSALERIRTALGRLKSSDFRRSVFGARSHNYQLNAALSDQAVADFERVHGVSLPEDYREFLVRIADGGAGPAYGVHTLAKAFENPWVPLGPLAAPFALESDQQGANYDGCLMVSQRGCGGWTFLIVSGPQRGEVWYDDTVVDQGWARAAESFVAWYERWLESSLARVAAQPKDDTAEFVARLTALCEQSPDRVAAVLEQEPDSDALLVPLIVVATDRVQANQPKPALAIYQRLFRLPVPTDAKLRRAYLESLNNGIIAGCLAGDMKAAAAIADRAQPFVEENPFITHSAACAYVGAGAHDKALEQCQLAVKLRYQHLDQLIADGDLAPLHGRSEWQALFGRSRS
jgi:hypothetical protein